MGAIGGGLIGMSADLTDRGVGRELAKKVSHALAADNGAIVADISSEARMKALGGAILGAA